jgi:hypothetical protein
MSIFTRTKFFSVVALLSAFAGTARAATYYVDAALGSDANSGISPTLAWASLAPFNRHTFDADDRILFHAGQTWAGVVEPHGSGTKERPIVLGSYGTGAKPLFKGNGTEFTLGLRDVSGWTVQDIAITNRGGAGEERMGILIRTSSFSFAIHLVRVAVSDVNGEVGSKSSGGIGVYAQGNTPVPAHFDDVLIDHCSISHVDGEGIWFKVQREGQRTYPNTNVRITGNTITDTGRNAMYLRGSLGAVVDHNVVRLAAAQKHGNAICIGWAKDTVVRENEVSETGINTGDHENGAFDVDDGAIGTVVEYNWSHDNAGGMVNVNTQPGCACDAYTTTIRYNVSENDGPRVFGVYGADHSTAIYNNTAYVGKGHSALLLQTGQYTHYPQLPDGILFARNVFFSEGKTTFEWHATDIRIDGNCYLGKPPNKTLPDAHMAVDVTPLHLSGQPAQSRSAAARYRLPAGSPCAGPSPAPRNAGDIDFLGSTIDANSIQIRGAIVSSSIESK